MALTKEQKLEIINNIKKKGDQGDIDFAEVIYSIDRMSKDMPEIPGNNNFSVPEGFFNKYYGISPNTLIDLVKTNKDIQKDLGGEINYNLDAFMNALNQSNLYPYKAAKTKDISSGESQWGFFKDIDRYEQSYDRQNNPVYLRFYKDGTYDTLDKETFNSEKYFNYMPDDMKSSYMKVIDEQNMSNEQKSKMYNAIDEHQYKMMTR